MKHLLLGLLALTSSMTLGLPGTTAAQSIKILGGNTLNGAITGTMLGGATMALRNSNDFAPLRVGIGAGTLYGLGTGAYDLSKFSKGGIYYVSGVFNDGDNTSIIVLLDTFYGAAAGAIIASSVNLIANKPIRDALQYGSGVGAFVGFGFGLLDGFVLSERPGDFGTPAPAGDAVDDDGGMISLIDRSKGYRISLLKPVVYTATRLSSSGAGIAYHPGLDMVNLNIRF